MERVRRIIDTRRTALEAVTRRLMECEVIDGTELKAIVDAHTGAPQLVPGTESDRRPVRPTAAEPLEGAAGTAEA